MGKEDGEESHDFFDDAFANDVIHISEGCKSRKIHSHASSYYAGSWELIINAKQDNSNTFNKQMKGEGGLEEDWFESRRIQVNEVAEGAADDDGGDKHEGDEKESGGGRVCGDVAKAHRGRGHRGEVERVHDARLLLQPVHHKPAHLCERGRVQ